MCSECLKDQQFISSTQFYCNLCKLCKLNEKEKTPVVLCQPVTDTSCRVREPVQDNTCIEKQDYSAVRIQLFPTHDILELENHKKKMKS